MIEAREPLMGFEALTLTLWGSDIVNKAGCVRARSLYPGCPSFERGWAYTSLIDEVSND